MSQFDPLTKLLDARSSPIHLFFRNDDGGWADQQLDQLCQWFHQRQLPLDIALIPTAMDSPSRKRIERWLGVKDSTIHIHQHGYSHENHQLEGRGCEFGSDRNLQQQEHDITRGKALLAEYFGNAVQPIFTPPWNRCTQNTISALKASEFKYLSRITGSTPLHDASPLKSLDVTIDWLKKRKGERLNPPELTNYIIECFQNSDDVLGIMLHHEHMMEDELALLDALVSVLIRSKNVIIEPMN